MIALRQRHPVLRAEAFYTEREIQWFGPKGRAPDWNSSSNALGCRIVTGREAGEEDHGLCLLFNADAHEQRFSLPAPPGGQAWQIIVDTGLPSPDEIREPGRERPLEDQRCYPLRDRSAVILVSG